MPTISDTYIENRHRVQPNHANNLGSVHGGYVMMWLDEVGAMSAGRFAGEACVTARVNRLSFERPIPTGHIVVIQSYVYEAGRTSVKVRLKASRENPRTGEQQRTTESDFVFVAVDSDGSPTRVPALDVESERDRELREAALSNGDRR
jgi:acyl-CoA hydrolase